jgi:hypothetical protein
MSDLSVETLNILGEHDCLRTDQTVDRKRITALLIDQLTEHHIAQSMEDVGQVEIDPGQLTQAIFGADPVDLVDLVKPLLSTGPDGAVQAGLENGYMLCSGRMSVDAVVAGQPKRVSFASRFLSADEAVIQAYLYDPRLRRAESAGENNRRLGLLVIQRQPALAARTSTWKNNLQQAFQLALTPGSES